MTGNGIETISLHSTDELLSRALRRLLVAEEFCVIDGEGEGSSGVQPSLLIVCLEPGEVGQAAARVAEARPTRRLPLLVLGAEPETLERLRGRPGPTVCLGPLFDCAQVLAAVRRFLPRALPDEPLRLKATSGIPA